MDIENYYFCLVIYVLLPLLTFNFRSLGIILNDSAENVHFLIIILEQKGVASFSKMKMYLARKIIKTKINAFYYHSFCT